MQAAIQDVATADGTLGYTRAGQGRHPILLLHGWPQTSHAWRRVQPLLAARWTTVALDLRGVGRSSPQAHGYDKATMAADVRTAHRNLGLDRPVLVGHDMGALVAYAFARRYPGYLAGLVIVDTPLPGIPGWDEIADSAAYWHLRFHSETGRGRPLADALVDGRQAVYFRSFIDRFAARPDAIDDADIAVYSLGYQDPERLAAGFTMFRTLPVDATDNQADKSPAAIPILLAYSEYSHATLLPAVRDGLRRNGATDVRTVIIPGSGHWPAEEQPAALAAIIDDFAVSARREYGRGDRHS
jgi:pimeloyl-ACP methyl ester carboxylesterase